MLTIREKYETNVKITTLDHDGMETVPKTIEVGWSYGYRWVES